MGETMNRAQRRARKGQGLPVQATITIPPDDITLVEALIAVQHIPDDDPEYLLARHMTRGTRPPSMLVALARAKARERSQDKTRMGVYRMLACNIAITRKAEAT